jgi:hypothetical protein
MMKKNRFMIIISWVAGLALLISACSGVFTPVQGSQPTQVEQPVDLPGELREVIVEGVSVDIGVGSPIPVEAVISGTWPGLCSQLGEIKQQEGERSFVISLFATPDQPSCPPDHVGLPFRIAIPLNMVEKPAGTYTISANGVKTTFEWKETAVNVESTEERFVFKNVSFYLNPAVSTSASGQLFPETPSSTDSPYWETHPEYVSISLDGYLLSQTTLHPVIAVYPIADYRRLSDQASKILDSLGNTLSRKPVDERQMPFLTLMNAGQVFHSNVKYLDFQNGSGVRYLAVLAQYPAPVNNQDLFYTYQGLTSDERYFVSIILPVSHTTLPMSANVLPVSELEAIAKAPTYYGNMAARLNALPDGSFAPDLAKLDALITSLVIEQ